MGQPIKRLAFLVLLLSSCLSSSLAAGLNETATPAPTRIYDAASVARLQEHLLSQGSRKRGVSPDSPLELGIAIPRILIDSLVSVQPLL